MKEESLTEKEVRSGSADARKTYSAKELAEVYMTSREDFFGINIEVTTHSWNLNFIYDFLYAVKFPQEIDNAIEWLVRSWEKSHHYRETYDLAFDKEINMNYLLFKGNLQNIKEKLDERYQAEKEEEELKMRMLGGYYGNDTITALHIQESVGKSGTDEPHFGGPDITPEPQFHMEDFDRHKISILLIADDETFSLFVQLVREKVWPKVTENKNKYCNAFRFVLMVNGVIAEKSTMTQFDDLLQALIPGIGSQLSSLKQRTDANNIIKTPK